MPQPIKLLDCTLRDGGYYNHWDFPRDVVEAYLQAMSAAGVDIVELGFRFWKNDGFKGACAFTTDAFLASLEIPPELTVGVMLNASDLIVDGALAQERLETLFPLKADDTPVSLVRFACHAKDFAAALPAAGWLRARGYQVGFNLMQAPDRTEEEILALARAAAEHNVDALYFADSMGSMNPAQTRTIAGWLRQGFAGELGIHTHDNLGLALSNTLAAHDAGVTWLDATVTGMGRGPGNARTEELAIEVAERRGKRVDLVPLMALIRRYFRPEQVEHGWGTNPYYYLAGKYGIHPTFVQEMMRDARYDEEDILAALEHLRDVGGKKYSAGTLEGARHFFVGEPRGDWSPRSMFDEREVMLLGSGPGVAAHREAIEAYVRERAPVVVALNTQSSIDAELIGVRVACHPVRLLADTDAHRALPQPLITPASMLPPSLRVALDGKELLDFGLSVEPGTFAFDDHHAVVPSSLVLAYTLAVLASGGAARVLMAGFDGYHAGDPRNDEVNMVLSAYQANRDAPPILSVTPTEYDLERSSIYGRLAPAR